MQGKFPHGRSMRCTRNILNVYLISNNGPATITNKCTAPISNKFPATISNNRTASISNDGPAAISNNCTVPISNCPASITHNGMAHGNWSRRQHYHIGGEMSGCLGEILGRVGEIFLTHWSHNGSPCTILVASARIPLRRHIKEEEEFYNVCWCFINILQIIQVTY